MTMGMSKQWGNNEMINNAEDANGKVCKGQEPTQTGLNDINCCVGPCYEPRMCRTGDRMDDGQTCEVMRAGNGLQQMYRLLCEHGSMRMCTGNEHEQLWRV